MVWIILGVALMAAGIFMNYGSLKWGEDTETFVAVGGTGAAVSILGIVILVVYLAH